MLILSAKRPNRLYFVDEALERLAYRLSRTYVFDEVGFCISDIYWADKEMGQKLLKLLDLAEMANKFLFAAESSADSGC